MDTEQSAAIEIQDWKSVKDGGYPEYYDLVWASDGEDVFLSMLLGRSYMRPKKEWANLERLGCDRLTGITHWMPATKPSAPKQRK